MIKMEGVEKINQKINVFVDNVSQEVKLEKNNNTFIKTYGGSSFDDCSMVHQTSDGGYIIAGQTRSFGSNNGSMWIIKTNMSKNPGRKHRAKTQKIFLIECINESEYVKKYMV